MKKKNTGGIVYSTDASFQFNEPEPEETPSPASQVLRVRFETKHRGGKAVTVVDGFKGDGNPVAKQLKTHCGTGGSFKDGQVLVQGNHREKVIQWLRKNGYTNVK